MSDDSKIKSDFDLSAHEHFDQRFQHLDLSEICLENVTFEDCVFESCDFSQGQFINCRFTQCEFLSCHLSMVSCNKTRFYEVSFKECKLLGIDWTLVDWPSLSLAAPISFEKSVLNDSCFFGLALSELTLVGCRAFDVDFREADLSQSNFRDTDFTRSLFSNTNLSRADFTQAQHYNIDIQNNYVKQAKFSRYEAALLLEYLDIELVD